MRNWPVLVAFAVLLMLAACPQTKQASGVDGTVSTAPPATAVGQEAAETPQPASDTPSPTAPGAEPAAEQKTAGPAVLHGEWLALFGRQDEGMLSDTWQQDQRIKFDKQGQVVFTISLKGQTAEVQGRFVASESGELKLVFSAAKALESGLSHVAPLGIGRNEEVGLLKQAGRNEEVGLTGGSSPDAAGNLTRSIKYRVYGDYMILSDSFDHIMVYTRFQAAPPAASEFNGAWTAKFGTAEDVVATATSSGNELTIEMGEQGLFTGTMISGVAVGKIKRANEIIMATLRADGTDRLSGLYLTAPYVELSSDLVLTRNK